MDVTGLKLEASLSFLYFPSVSAQQCRLMWPLANYVMIFLFKLPTRRTNYPNLFCHKTLHISGNLFAHHQEFSAVHWALVSFMQVLMIVSKQS
jgi:hypothetical protein